MAEHQSHVSFSVSVALMYGVFGLVVLNINPEIIVLASVVLVISGLLPNIDASKDKTAVEVVGLLSAITPLIILEFYPSLKTSGVSRMALIIIICYVVARYVASKFLEVFTVRRGMMHSIPAAIICTELTFLLFTDLVWRTRSYVAGAALAGYLSHLTLDAYTNLNAGNAGKKPPVFKLKTNNTISTLILYAIAIGLGWLVMKAIYPSAQVRAPVTY